MNLPEQLRNHLSEAYQSLGRPGASVRIPRAADLVKAPAKGHFHLRAELFVQRSGATLFRFPGQELELAADEVLLVPPRLYHAEAVVPGAPFGNVVLYADETGLSCHWADGTPETGPRIAYPEDRVGPGCGRIARWLSDASQVALEVPDAQAVVVDLVRSVLALTLQLLELPPTEDEEAPLVVVRCRRLVHEELGNAALSVGALAKKLGCSADYLSHRFRTATGEKLTAYIEAQRMERAAELLRATPLSVKEVAWASGYANQSYFIRCFSRRWGAPPGEWRVARPGRPH